MNSNDSLAALLSGPVAEWAAPSPNALPSRLVQDALGTSGNWFSHAGLLQLLLWDNQTALAADLAEQTIAAFNADAGRGPQLADEEYPFNDALLAERRHSEAGNDARLQRVGGSLTSDSILGQRIAWLRANLAAHPLDRLLTGYNGWQEPAEPLGPAYAKLVAKFDTLSAGEVGRLWTGAYNAHDVELADRLASRYGPVFPIWYVGSWWAGIQAERGDLDGSRQTLRAARDRFLPFAEWDLLPLDPVLQTAFEPVASAEFRREFVADLSPVPPWEKR